MSRRRDWSGRQLSFTEVNKARDDAMQRVGYKAGPRFVSAASEFVERYLRKHGPTSAEKLSLRCKEAGIRPHDDRAFGPVYMGLARRGVIRKVGQVRRERGHGTAGGNIWSHT